MKKSKFLQELQKRATEQQKLRRDIPYPRLFQFIGVHLGNHPWKPLIPISVIVSFVFYIILGNIYIEFILWLFKIL